MAAKSETEDAAAADAGTAAAGALRIGDVARIVGTTPRTIRYYEEIGLLPGPPNRLAGGHRLYTEAEVDRLREVMRLRNLLGVSLEELKTLLDAEEARAAVRAELRRGDVGEARRRELLGDALHHIERQLELVHKRFDELSKLKGELTEKQRLVRHRLRELDRHEAPGHSAAGSPAPRRPSRDGAPRGKARAT